MPPPFLPPISLTDLAVVLWYAGCLLAVTLVAAGLLVGHRPRQRGARRVIEPRGADDRRLAANAVGYNGEHTSWDIPAWTPAHTGRAARRRYDGRHHIADRPQWASRNLLEHTVEISAAERLAVVAAARRRELVGAR